MLKNKSVNSIKNEAERKFIKQVADKNKTYIHQPKQIILSDGRVYRPDFYCEDDEKYIEVFGTRHRYYAVKKRLPLIKKCVNLDVVFLYHKNPVWISAKKKAKFKDTIEGGTETFYLDAETRAEVWKRAKARKVGRGKIIVEFVKYGIRKEKAQ